MRPGRANVCPVRRADVELEPELLLAAATRVVARRDVLTSAIRRGRFRHLDWRALYRDFHFVPNPAAADAVEMDECRDPRDLWSDARPFDFAKPPFLRVRYARDRQGMLVSLTVNHCMVDQYAINLVWRDLAALYGGLASGVDARLPTPASFLSYAAERYRAREAGRMNRQIDFWRSILGQFEPEPLPPVAGSAGARVPRNVGRQASVCSTLGTPAKPLLERSRQLRVTPFAALLGMYGAALGRVFGWDRVVLLVPHVNRRATETEIVGHLATMLYVPLERLNAPLDAVIKEAAARLMKGMLTMVSPADAVGVEGLKRLGKPLLVVRGLGRAGLSNRQDQPEVLNGVSSHDGLLRVVAEPPLGVSADAGAVVFGTDTDLLLDTAVGNAVDMTLHYRLDSVAEESARALLAAMDSLLV